jgi:hypothetical protein
MDRWRDVPEGILRGCSVARGLQANSIDRASLLIGGRSNENGPFEAGSAETDGFIAVYENAFGEARNRRFRCRSLPIRQLSN